MAKIINPIILMTGGENRLKAFFADEITEITAEDFGNATTISTYQFAYKTAITTVDIPNTITAIDSYAFYQCTNLQGSFDLPNTAVAQDAFRNTNISKLRCAADDGYTGVRLCADCPLIEVIEITEGCTQAYKSLVDNAPAIQYLILPSTLTKIKSGAIVGSIPNLVLKCTSVPNTDSVSVSGTNLFVPLSAISSYESSTYFSSFAKYPIVTTQSQANAYTKCLVDTNGDLVLWEQQSGIWYNRGQINQF